MANLLERAARWTKARLDNAAAIEVTVRDGNEAIEQVKAIPGQSSFASFSMDEHSGTAKTFDWIVSAADLVFDGEKREPQKGWEIWHRLDDGRTAVYLALPIDARCFDVVDQLGILYRIHTNLDRIMTA